MLKRSPHLWRDLSGCLLLALLLGVGGVGEASAEEINPYPLLDQCQAPRSNPQTAELAALVARSQEDEARLLSLIDRLGKSCDKEALDPLIGLLSNPSARVRMASIEALGRSGQQEAIDPLINILLGETDEVRPALVRALLSLQFQNARAAVLNMFTHPLANPVERVEDMRVRACAILTFNQLNNTAYNQKAIGFLRTFMQSSNPEIVKIATETLTKLPQTRNGAREMIGLVRSNNIPMIRIWMCEWLGRLKVVEARGTLEQVAKSDPNQNARAAAAAALQNLGN